MNTKIRDLLERFAQRLIDSNARSRTYFLGSLKTADVVDLHQYAEMFAPNIHLGNSVLKHSTIVFPYRAVSPSRIKEVLSQSLAAKGLTVDFDGAISYKEVLSKENVAKYGITKEFINRAANKVLTGINEKDVATLYNALVKNHTIDLHNLFISLCDKYNESSRTRYATLDALNTNARNLEKESARTELYVGYPFIEGTFFSGKFFRAPLFLHGAVIESTPNLKKIKFTDEVYINPVFMISYVVENKMPHQRFNFDLSESADIVKSATKYLKDKLNLNLDLTKIGKTESFNSVTKPTYEKKYKLYPGEYKVMNNAVIGIFPISSKSIYYDIKQIIEKDTCNALLKNFLAKHQKDNRVEEYFGQSEDAETKENKLYTITDCDITQKMIIRDSLTQNLVIQGPPGTGKSQTIVNIIASNVCKGRKVLVVSEKKTAIDVLYNRLDKLSKFSCIVRNVSTDKVNFYTQLRDTLEMIKSVEISEQKRNRLAQKNRIINRFFGLVGKYGAMASADYDGYTFDELCLAARNVNGKIPKDIYDKVCYFGNKYESFSDVINRVYREDYLDEFYNLKSELDGYKTYGILHYDINAIRAVKNILTQNVSKRQKRYLFNRIYYGLPVTEYKHALKRSPNKEVKKHYKTVSGEILNIDLDIFNEGDSLYNDPEILDFITHNKFDIEEIASIYKKVLYDQAVKNNKDAIKFIANYENEVKSVFNASEEKMSLAVDDILTMIVNNVLIETQKNRDLFEGVKELERLSNLQRKKSVSFVMEKNFGALKTLYPVWLMTPDVASTVLPCLEDVFDLVIFDEASQMFVENAVGILFRAKRCVVAGDSKQLRPLSIFQNRYVEDEFVLDSDKMEKVNIAALEEESLLDYAAHRFIERTLRYHYRSEHRNLIEFSSSAFYKNKLYFASSNKQYDYKPIEVVQVSNGLWNDNVNLTEAQAVIAKVAEVIRTKKKSDTVGIITFNEQQRKTIERGIEKLVGSCDDELKLLLTRELNRVDSDTLEDTSMFIKNIENVQGDERDIIIFSVTYAKNKDGKLNSSFGLLSMANGENRLNVAITRAKKRIIVVKSFYAYELNINDANPGPYYLKKFIEYSELASADREQEKQMLLKSLYYDSEQSEYKGNDLLRQDLVVRLKKKLPDGYSVQSDVAVGSFVFDVGIYKRNQLVLCIKSDQGLSVPSVFEHENDYYCDLYLKNRGYKFVRVFKYLYWKNPSNEIKNILTVLKIKQL